MREIKKRHRRERGVEAYECYVIGGLKVPGENKKKWIQKWMKEKNYSIEELRKFEMILDGIGDKIIQWDRTGLRFAADLKNHYEVLKNCGHESAPQDVHMEEIRAITFAMLLINELLNEQSDY